jgi:hypothetical protein
MVLTAVWAAAFFLWHDINLPYKKDLVVREVKYGILIVTLKNSI